MNKEQFAEMLNGRQYRSELTKKEEQTAKENGLLVCFGCSDDLLELIGLIYEELGAWDETSVFLFQKKGGDIGVMSKSQLDDIRCFIDDNELNFNLPEVEIFAEWAPKDPVCSWLIKSELPHATFDIMEDDDLYCRGIVIEKADIENALK